MLRALLASLTILLTVSTTGCATFDQSSERFDVNVDKTNLAIGGYDPTTYFSAGRPQRGDFMIASEYDGATYWFVSEASQAQFESSPETYVPAYGGYCAYGVSIGKKFSVSPEVYKVEDGVLYLNLNPAIADVFNEDVDGNIGKAEAAWPAIKDQPAGVL